MLETVVVLLLLSKLWNFVCMLPVAIALSCAGGVAVHSIYIFSLVNGIIFSFVECGPNAIMSLLHRHQYYVHSPLLCVGCSAICQFWNYSAMCIIFDF